ncbi:MAG: hypothetical protein IT381_21035 [Deltaproteobacteria bacterium]|nr:hypothetical protein [Deltaproteobacteria bacterium]
MIGVLFFVASFDWRGPVEHRAEVEATAKKTYAELQTTYARATGASAPEPGAIVIEPGEALNARHAGTASLGRIRVRAGNVSALRHEIAHQFLFGVCAHASEDKLFHEAFAIAVSGELEAWIDEGYFSSTKAVAILTGGARLDGAFDGTEARRALARLVADGAQAGALPLAIERRLKMCASGERWRPMRVEELSAPSEPLTGDAFVVLSRHSGEILVKEGEVETAMPFGSTLKPFVAAGAREALPALAVDAKDPLWRCGEALPKTMTLAEALARSCNGYFLAWAKRAAGLEAFGAYGPLLIALGLARAPAAIDEALGLRPTLALSPWALAQAYRALAAARPELMAMLEATPTHGTLLGLGVEGALSGVAMKSGTVRDPENRVQLGWLVGVSADHVIVMARQGKMPRAFAEDFAGRVTAVKKRELEAAARVQSFALLDGDDVELACDGVPVAISAGAPLLLPRTFRAIARLVSQENDRALCLGRPFVARRVATDTSGMNGRLYAGVLARDSAPRLAGSDAATPRARRGSDYIFTTTEARYVAGVLQSEDAAISGEARRALAKVILHNVRSAAERHGGRPVCDTTHCQAFLGTPKEALAAKGVAGLAPWIDARGWLPFSRGGAEPWQIAKPRAEVARLLGVDAVSLAFGKGQARVRVVDPVTLVEHDELIACERLRGPLKLPACPSSATIDGGVFVFRGVGAGHGEGLAVEAAKQSSGDAEAILRQAYRVQ